MKKFLTLVFTAMVACASFAQEATSAVSFFAKNTISAPAGYIAPKSAKAGGSNLELVEPSTEVLAAAEEWNMRGNNWYDQSTFTRTVTVAVVDGEIYMQGLSPDIVPYAWLKGSIADDGTVSFPQFTFAGSYGYFPTIYFCNIQWTDEGEFDSFGYITGTYDADTETFTFTSDVALNTDLETAGHFGTQAIGAGSIITRGELPEVEAVTGEPVDVLPFNATFLDTDECFAQFGVIDANDDANTWAWDLSKGAFYRYNSKKDADDYLISPAIKVEGGKNYYVTINAKASSSGYPERIEVLAGTAPKVSALKISVIPATDITSTSSDDYVAMFTAPETGYYHFAAHAISDADQDNLLLNSMTIEQGPDPKAPEAVEDLVVTPGEKGQKSATVDFIVPTASVDGEPLEATEIKVTIYVNGAAVKSTKVQPGYHMNTVLNRFETSAMYNFTVICENGELIGKKAVANVYIGFDVPACPTGLKVIDAGDHIHFTWNKCSEVGANGGYVDPSQVSYQVWECVDAIPGWGFYIPNEVLCRPLRDVDSFDYTFDCNSGSLGQYVYCIYAQNEAGKSSLNDSGYGYGYFGAPLNIPAHEGFEGGYGEYDWFILGDENIDAILVNEGSTDPYSIELSSAEGNEIGGLTSTKFTLAGTENATVTADLYTTTLGTTITLFVEADGEKTELQTYALTDEWTTYKWNVSAFANKSAVRFRFSGNFTEEGSFLFDNFNVFDDDSSNGIYNIEAAADKKIYTVNGLRILEPKKSGVYIVNGKKVVIK